MTATPDPVGPDCIRKLCIGVGGQMAASRLLHVDGRTVRRWVSGKTGCPWMAAELLRRIHEQALHEATP